MESVFGIPSHPLFVHLPIVAVPVAALASIVLAFSADARRRLSGWLAAVAGVGLVGTFLATRSGEAFYDAIEDRIGELAETHEELGRRTLILVALFFVGSVITAVVERMSHLSDDLDGSDDASGDASGGRLRLPSSVLAAGTAVLGVVATIWMIRTGHEGARIVWDGVLPAE